MLQLRIGCRVCVQTFTRGARVRDAFREEFCAVDQYSTYCVTSESFFLTGNEGPEAYAKGWYFFAGPPKGISTATGRGFYVAMTVYLFGRLFSVFIDCRSYGSGLFVVVMARGELRG